MRIKSILTAGLALIAITLIGNRTAHADNFRWLGVDPELEWCNPANWLNLNDPFLGDYPDDADDKAFVGAGVFNGCVGLCGDTTIGVLVIEDDGCVFVTNGHTLTITDTGTRNGRLTIEPGGTLGIANGRVELAGDGVSHKIGGSVLLTSSTSILLISGDATLDPFTKRFISSGGGPRPVYGKVKGQHNSAEIQIKRGKTLTNNITICGQMIIKAVP